MAYQDNCSNSYGQAGYLNGGMDLVPYCIPVGGEKEILKHGSLVSANSNLFCISSALLKCINFTGS